MKHSCANALRRSDVDLHFPVLNFAFSMRKSDIKPGEAFSDDS